MLSVVVVCFGFPFGTRIGSSFVFIAFLQPPELLMETNENTEVRILERLGE